MRIPNPKSGQVLLITIMLLATIMTITLAITFRSTTETQTSKLEEESQKTLSAAEAGIEASLKYDIGHPAVPINSLSNLSSFTGQTTINTYLQTTYVTPLLLKDQQYTFYLSTYPDLTSVNYPVQLSLYYSSESTDCNSLALEISIISDSTNINRYIADAGGTLGGSGNIGFPNDSGSTFTNDHFICRALLPFPLPAQSKLLVVRVLFSATKLGFYGTVNLPNQGKYVTSTATSQTGVTKKVQLIQSYPQLPAEFFVTSF